MNKKHLFTLAGLLFAGGASLAASAPPDRAMAAPWPAATATTRPWTWWLWMGNVMDEANLQRQLREIRDAGIGGVTIYPFYGARGYEARFNDFLSPRWVELYRAALRTAAADGLGVDLNPVGGFPAGGAWVTREDASSAGELRRYAVNEGQELDVPLPRGKVQYLLGVGPDGRKLDLTPHVKDGFLDWTAPSGNWKLYAIVQRQPVQKVKRPAPGGAGYVLDPFSVVAMDHYVARFDEAFRGVREAPPRAQFQDSWEQITSLAPGGSIPANWTNDFFAEFIRRRGYDLRTQVPAFFGEGDPDTVARVRYDYRETVNLLHQASTARWTELSHARGSLTRYQAHCSPSNIEDTYAAVDIPETEGAFLGGPDLQIPFIKFASSAAHLTGRPLASSETFTWLAEHFQVSLADLKPALDRFFLGGINHIVFSSGIGNTPADVPWPGWMAYWSVDFGPNGGLWHDLPAFSAYVTRCQSILQSGKPANDFLLYFPMADFWQIPGEKIVRRRVWNEDAGVNGGVLPYEDLADEAPALEFQHVGNWNGKGWGPGFIEGGAFHRAGMECWDRGYSYDSVTDQLLAGAKFTQGAIELGGNPYRAVVLPPCRLLPVETLRCLVALAKAGATIIVQGALPADVPGLNRLAERRSEYRGLLAEIALPAAPTDGIRRAAVGRGFVLVGPDLSALLREAGIVPEGMTSAGLQCVRRRQPEGFDYFIVNKSDRAVAQWVALATPAVSAVLLDPQAADRVGLAAVRPSRSGQSEVYLQMQPGESLILRTSTSVRLTGPAWPYEIAAKGSSRALSGPWLVHFTEGGPALPRDYTAKSLASWTRQNDPEAKRFAGTATYRTEFDFSPATAADWRLDLGQVGDSARVRINGREVTTLWYPPFSLAVGRYLRAGRNTVEVDVTNLAANRIADLDRRHVKWNNFYNIGVVNIRYQPFDASGWPLRASGLIGPVALVPMQTVNPAHE